MSIENLLAMKASEHGSYTGVSRRFLRIVSAILGGADPSKLSPEQQTTLYMIAMKLARIVEGNSNHDDHWRDIQGYAALAERSIESSRAASLQEDIIASISPEDLEKGLYND